MNDAGVIFLLGYALFWGMRKGASVCVTICTPSLIPHIIERKMSWRQGLKAGIIFNLPRIIFLTALFKPILFYFILLGEKQSFLPIPLTKASAIVSV